MSGNNGSPPSAANRFVSPSPSPTKPSFGVRFPPRRDSSPAQIVSSSAPKRPPPQSPAHGRPQSSAHARPPATPPRPQLPALTSSAPSIPQTLSPVKKSPFTLSSERIKPMDLAVEPFPSLGGRKYSVVDVELEAFRELPRKKRSESICIVASDIAFMSKSLSRSNSEPFLHSWDICPVFDGTRSRGGSREALPMAERMTLSEGSFISPEEETIEGKEEVGDITFTTAAGGHHKIVFSATPDALMRLLVQPSDIVRDSEYLDTFVITHGYFIDAGTFLDDIIYKFFHVEEELGLGAGPQQSRAVGFLFYVEDEENNKKKEAAQLRIINILKRWLKYNAQHLGKEPHLKIVFERFVSDLIVAEGQISKWSEPLTRAMQKEKEAVVPSKVDPKKQKETKKKEKNSFIDFNPVAVAQQLTLMEFERFKKINGKELLFKNFQEPSTSPGLHESIQYFNKLSMWVASEIVSTPNIRQRASILARFIEFASALRKINNFNSLMSVMSALQHSAITRLKQTWKLISPKHTQTFDQLCELAALEGNHGAYRIAIQRATLPFIPYQGLYLKDLTFIEEKPTVTDNDHINFSKLNHLAKIVTSVQQAQEYPYKNLSHDPAIQALLEDLSVLDEATIYQLSRSIEARQTAAVPDAIVAQLKRERDEKKKQKQAKTKDEKDKQRTKSSQKTKRSLEDNDDSKSVISPPHSPRSSNDATKKTIPQLQLQTQLAERLNQTPQTTSPSSPRAQFVTSRSNSISSFSYGAVKTPTKMTHQLPLAQPITSPNTSPNSSFTSLSVMPKSEQKKRSTSTEDAVINPLLEVQSLAEQEKRRARKTRELQTKLDEQIAVNKNLEAQIEALQTAQAAMGENNLLKKELIDLKEQLQKKEGEIRELKSKPSALTPRAVPKTAASTRREAAELKELKEKLSIESKMRFLIYEELKNIKKGLDSVTNIPQCMTASASLEKMMQFFPLDTL